MLLIMKPFLPGFDQFRFSQISFKYLHFLVDFFDSFSFFQNCLVFADKINVYYNITYTEQN